MKLADLSSIIKKECIEFHDRIISSFIFQHTFSDFELMQFIFCGSLKGSKCNIHAVDKSCEKDYQNVLQLLYIRTFGV